TPAPPTLDPLEALVADDPDDPEAHRALGEALIEAGDRDRGIEELDHATAGFENLGNLPQAQHLGEEILRLDPNSVRHRQKQVEYAFKSGDKAKLVDAYLELADTLLRGDLPDKARAVYQRVAEHDARNERAKAALAMLAPAAAPPPTAGSKTSARGPGRSPRRNDVSQQLAPVSLGDIQRPVAGELELVAEELRRIITADFPIIAEVNEHLLRMKGKLFRPTLLLLSQRASGAEDARTVTLAAVVELIHLATLVHDDSVVHSVLRRGVTT